MASTRIPFRLSDDEVGQLRRQIRTGTWLARDLIRARILLLSHEKPETTQAAVAQETGCSIDKVQRTRERYRAEGLVAALHDKPRSGHPCLLLPEHEAFIIATACTDTPKGTDHWTVSLLTEKLALQQGITVCHETVRKVLLRNNLKPWLKKNVVRAEAGQTIRRANA